MKKKRIRKYLLFFMILFFTAGSVGTLSGIEYVNAETAPTEFLWPVENPNTTAPHNEWRSNPPHYHYGMDIVSKTGSRKIMAAQSGTVTYAGWNGAYGITVIIKHSGKRWTRYSHLDSICVKTKKTVVAGQKIGIMGNTGASYGVHLHFGIYTRNPIGLNEYYGGSASKATRKAAVKRDTINPKNVCVKKLSGIKSHKFSYNLYGGSGTFKPQTVQDNGTLKIPTAKPTKPGCTFTGWCVVRDDKKWYVAGKGWLDYDTVKSKNYTFKKYSPGDSLVIGDSWTTGRPSANYTFWAQWQNASIKVQFNNNSGTGSIPERTVAITSGATKVDCRNLGLQKTGYALDGWKVQKKSGGSSYWIVANGSGWTWKKDAAAAERKLLRFTDSLTFPSGSVGNGDTIVFWASWKAVGQGSQTIPNGIYHITSALDPGFGLDVYGGYAESGTNVQLYKNATDKTQTFAVKYVGSGYYSIISTISAKSLDVYDAGQRNGTNVHVYKQNNTDAQRWIIKDRGDGTFSIISKCNGLCVDVAGSRAVNRANIQMYQEDVNSAAQRWRFVSADMQGSQTVPDGVYHITSALNAEFGLDVYNGSPESRTNVQLYRNINDRTQTFEVSYMGSGYYSIISTIGGKSLDVYDAGNYNGVNVWVYDPNYREAQQWIIKDRGDGTYSIFSRCNELCLDVKGSKAVNGANIQMYKEDQSSLAQRWKFIPAN